MILFPVIGKRQQLNEGERAAETDENTGDEKQRQGPSESEERNEVASESDKCQSSESESPLKTLQEDQILSESTESDESERRRSNDDNHGQISAPPDTATKTFLQQTSFQLAISRKECQEIYCKKTVFLDGDRHTIQGLTKSWTDVLADAFF
ncbi:unnamed protein product, partial [Allacma fusca]